MKIQLVDGAEYELASKFGVYLFQMFCFWNGYKAEMTHIKWDNKWRQTYIVKTTRPDWTGGIVGRR